MSPSRWIMGGSLAWLGSGDASSHGKGGGHAAQCISAGYRGSSFVVSHACADMGAEGWYGAASGGKAWFESDDFIGGTSGPITQKFGHEYGVGGAIGYAFQHIPLRLEGEFTYFHADVTALPGTLTTFKGGSDKHYVGMANLYYDVALSGMLQRLKPYIGVGVGFDVEQWGLSLVAPSGMSTAGRFDTEVFLAYQAKAGLAYALTDRWDVLAGYRYFRTEERSLDSPTRQTPFPHDAQSLHFAEFGLRWHF